MKETEQLKMLTESLGRLEEEDYPASSNHWDLYHHTGFEAANVALDKELETAKELLRTGYMQYKDIHTAHEAAWRYMMAKMGTMEDFGATDSEPLNYMEKQLDIYASGLYREIYK